jgi:hypothetical protein
LDAKRLLGVMVRLIPLLLVAACGRTEDGKPRPPCTPIPEPTRTLYVAASPNCGAGSPCYRSIQDAVDAASGGDLIKVAGGVYTTTESQVLTVKKGVHLVGGYRVEDWSEPDPVAQPTILDAGRVPGRRAVLVDGRDALTITLAGFQIQRGDAKELEGGGVYIAGGSVLLDGNSILSSTTEVSGGGVFVSGGQVSLRHNLIQGNSAAYGGGLYVDGGEVLMEGDVFRENVAEPEGGAIALGGGIMTGTNVSIVQNPLAGAGVYLCGGHLAGNHWTLADNGRHGVITQLGIDQYRGLLELKNSIVAYHNTGVGGARAHAHQTLFHEVAIPCDPGASCVSNLFGDPAFVDRLHGDYHIQHDSAAVDQGYGMDVPIDMDGETRPMGSASDIGADEVDAREFRYLPLVVRQSTAGSR